MSWQKQPQLALEYAGKATKIRQSILGDNHPVTISSLDFFTKVYAEAGADQYQDSMKRFENQGAGDPSDQDVETMIPQSSEREPQSILRRRKPGERDAEKRVRFDDSVKKSEDEEQCAKIFLWILFAICGVILLILGVYLYCHISSGSSCQSYKHQIKHVWDRIKYYYYHYTQSKLRKFVWIQILFNEKRTKFIEFWKMYRRIWTYAMGTISKADTDFLSQFIRLFLNWFTSPCKEKVNIGKLVEQSPSFYSEILMNFTTLFLLN